MFKRSIVLILMTLAGGGCLFGRGSSSPSVPGQEHRQPPVDIATGPFDVAARAFKPFKIVVPAGVKNARIEGKFSASGGWGDDIEVTLLEETQFLNWQNRHKFLPLYQSGRITADRIRVSLPADAATYVMVFNNRFSLMSSKGVVAEVKLLYDPLEK